MSANPPIPITLEIKGIGDNDQVPYSKADIVKVCRMGSNYAFGFYQLDYSAVASAAAGMSGLSLAQMKPMVLSKIVMDQEGFNQFKKEFETLVRMVETGDANPRQG